MTPDNPTKAQADGSPVWSVNCLLFSSQHWLIVPDNQRIPVKGKTFFSFASIHVVTRTERIEPFSMLLC